ncbi:MAG TPA: hypothetical protein QGH10_00555 [Armatimonadota bacterium]|nr:hypothetical protein [Armatimonadota bacterium]
MTETPVEPTELNPWYRRLAAVSIGLALLGTVATPILAALGLVLGAACWRLIRNAGGDRKDADTSIMGTVFSALVLVAMLTLPPVIRKMGDEAGRGMCAAQQKQLHVAMSAYYTDYDACYPLADNWSDALREVSGVPEAAFICPKQVDLRSGFVLNERVAGVHRDAKPPPDDLVVLFEGATGWNGSGWSQEFVARHGPFGAVLCADGVVKWIKPEQVSEVSWDP